MKKLFVGQLFYEGLDYSGELEKTIENCHSWCLVNIDSDEGEIDELRLHDSGTYFIHIRFDGACRFEYVGGNCLWSSWSSVPKCILEMCLGIINEFFPEKTIEVNLDENPCKYD